MNVAPRYILEVHTGQQQPPESTAQSLATGIIFVILGIGVAVGLLVLMIVPAIFG